MGLGALWRDFKDDLLTYRTVKVRFFCFGFPRARCEREKIPRALFSANLGIAYPS
jgi:hypothetical protein